MLPRPAIRLLPPAATLLLLAACAAPLPAQLPGAGAEGTVPVQVPVAVRFAARVGAQPFRCGAGYDGIGRTASRITPSDFRFYVSSVALLDEDGRAVPLRLEQDGRWQYRDVALLDFEDGSGPCRNGNAGLHEAVTGHVQAGRYRGLQFTLGVPADLNHGDPAVAPPPLNLSAMFWSWQAGYKFVKIDMATRGQARGGTAPPADAAPVPAAAPRRRAAGFPIHLGSTDCVSPAATAAPSSCARPNRVTVRLDAFDVATEQVEFDLAALLRDTDVDVNAPDSAPGCMAGPDDADCRFVMPAFGLPFDGQPALPQRVFRAAPRG